MHLSQVKNPAIKNLFIRFSIEIKLKNYFKGDIASKIQFTLALLKRLCNQRNIFKANFHSMVGYFPKFHNNPNFGSYPRKEACIYAFLFCLCMIRKTIFFRIIELTWIDVCIIFLHWGIKYLLVDSIRPSYLEKLLKFSRTRGSNQTHYHRFSKLFRKYKWRKT